MLSAKLINKINTAEIIKQVNFGTAVGLTKTAKMAQSATQESLDSNFTIRNKWSRVGPYAIKITPARPATLQATVYTNANWLKPHEDGTDKHAQGGSIAVPTENVRRNKRLIIPKAQRPRGLAAKAFKLQTKRGVVLATRQGRGKAKKLVILYGLESVVRIKKRPTFREPIQKVVDTRLRLNIANAITNAFKTMR